MRLFIHASNVHQGGGAVLLLPSDVISSACAGMSQAAVRESFLPPHKQVELVQKQLNCSVMGASLGSFGNKPPSSRMPFPTHSLEHSTARTVPFSVLRETQRMSLPCKG